MVEMIDCSRQERAKQKFKTSCRIRCQERPCEIWPCPIRVCRLSRRERSGTSNTLFASAARVFPRVNSFLHSFLFQFHSNCPQAGRDLVGMLCESNEVARSSARLSRQLVAEGGKDHQHRPVKLSSATRIPQTGIAQVVLKQ
jgi:hypothetical protein